MREFNFTVSDPDGIHARPAGLLVKAAKAFESTVTVFAGDKNADMKKLLALMALAIKQGQTITVKVEGADEDAAAEAVEKFLKDTF
ncbi:HPr family phosphocarrier protein [Lachnoclostridium sp. Marseille-P6806]|uniref:HPr family phosphocarrier protein n=1 Tax=Lachnoclostridium sp. Marseille-P6806 TaxID=2364793 RepID=UPI001030CE57|nr:HPr family phosphocarrier protein [Lachnoclostridium sp. Marseille-P6806]